MLECARARAFAREQAEQGSDKADTSRVCGGVGFEAVQAARNSQA